MDFPFVKEAILQLFSRPSTRLYPVVSSEAAPGYRGRISYDPEKCIGCGMCEKVCAGGAITRTVEKLEDGSSRITLSFDMGSCTFCSHCADFCSSKAITLTNNYHMAVTDGKDLIESGSFIKAAPKKPAPKAAPAANAPAAAKVAAEKPVPTVKPREDGKPVSDPALCVYCTLCAKKCPAEALTVDRAAKTWQLDEDKCIACGTCAEACPKKCIVM